MDPTITPDQTTANVSTVSGIYQAFGTGDIPAILATLDPHVAWDHWPDMSTQVAGVPYLQARTGPEEVALFFQQLAGLTFHELDVRHVTGGADTVVAEIHVRLQVPGGAEIEDEEVHLWRFGSDGRVTSFRHYVDTAKHIAAHNG